MNEKQLIEIDKENRYKHVIDLSVMDFLPHLLWRIGRNNWLWLWSLFSFSHKPMSFGITINQSIAGSWIQLIFCALWWLESEYDSSNECFKMGSYQKIQWSEFVYFIEISFAHALCEARVFFGLVIAFLWDQTKGNVG